MGEPLRRIILDTDLAMGAPGSDIDDGFALALALADPALAGRAGDHGRRQQRRGDLDPPDPRAARRCSGRADVPVVRGRAPTRSTATPAEDACVRRVLAEPGELTVVAIGPLTNLARALVLEPRVAERGRARSS